MIKAKTGKPLEASRSRSQIIVLFVALIVFIVLLFANFAYLNTQSTYDKQYIGHAGELRVLSQRIAKNATEAAAGKPAAFKLLSDARNDFAQRWGSLKQGDPVTGLPPAPATLRPQMRAVQLDWERLLKNTDAILSSEQTVLSLHQVAATLAETVPQLQVEYEKVVEILLQRGAPAAQVAMAQRQSLLAERILGAVNTVLAGDENASQAADTFGRDAARFGQVLNGMLQGDPALKISQVQDRDARARLSEISELFEFVSGSVDEILETSPRAVQGPRIGRQHLQPVADPARRGFAPGHRLRKPRRRAFRQYHRRLCAGFAGADVDHPDWPGDGPRNQPPVARNRTKERAQPERDHAVAG